MVHLELTFYHLTLAPDELLFHRFNVDVGEVDIKEFHAADLLELFLYSSSSF